MKKRRTTIIALLLVAALALGIGYANLTDQLKITGSATIDKDDAAESFKADIYFSKAISGEKATAAIDSGNNNLATMTVTEGALKEVGDEAVATFTIKSESDLAVTVTNPTTDNGCITYGAAEMKNYFEVTTNWAADHTLTPSATGATTDITVTVKMIKTPSTDQNLTFTILLNANAVTA